MAVSTPVQLKKALVIAAGGQSTAGDGYAGNQLAGLARVLNANQPRLCFALRADLRAHHVDIARQVDVAAAHALRHQHRSCAVSSIFFAEAAKVQLHTGFGQANARAFALYRLPANQCARGVEHGLARQHRLAKIPSTSEHA